MAQLGQTGQGQANERFDEGVTGPLFVNALLAGFVMGHTGFGRTHTGTVVCLPSGGPAQHPGAGWVAYPPGAQCRCWLGCLPSRGSICVLGGNGGPLE